MQWYFIGSPRLMRVGSEIVLTFYSSDRGQQELLWISEEGDVNREQFLDLFNVCYAYPAGENVVLIQYVSTIEDTFRWDVMSACTYDSDGLLLSLDTLLTDTFGQYDVFAGVAFDTLNGELLAAAFVAHGLQYLEDYQARLVFYQNGEVQQLPPAALGSPPEETYFSRFTVSLLPGGFRYCVVGFNAVHVREVNELRFLAVNSAGYPYASFMKTLALDPQKMTTGFDVLATGNQVYAVFTTADWDFADTLLNGMHFTGFPLSDILEADEPRASSLPHEFSLTAYPNPFNAVTRLEYSLPIAAHVNLKVYDISGRQSAQWNIGMQTAGTHSLSWSADHLPSGIYFARLAAGSHFTTHKLVLLK